eukprot:scaffold507799_cov34-Prasinocladus_malaysianus.AAC.1
MLDIQSGGANVQRDSERGCVHVSLWTVRGCWMPARSWAPVSVSGTCLCGQGRAELRQAGGEES